MYDLVAATPISIPELTYTPPFSILFIYDPTLLTIPIENKSLSFIISKTLIRSYVSPLCVIITNNESLKKLINKLYHIHTHLHNTYYYLYLCS